MKNLVFFTFLLVAPFLISSTGTSTPSTDLADELVGVYTGMFAKDGSLDKAYKVKVTKLDANTIKVTPFVANSKSFKATVKEDNLSALRIIRLTAMDGVVLQNGMMTPINGRLSYGLSKGETEQLEVFSGLKK